MAGSNSLKTPLVAPKEPWSLPVAPVSGIATKAVNACSEAFLYTRFGTSADFVTRRDVRGAAEK